MSAVYLSVGVEVALVLLLSLFIVTKIDVFQCFTSIQVPVDLEVFSLLFIFYLFFL